MTAKEFVFCVEQAGTTSGLAYHQQKMSILRLEIEDLDISLVGRLYVKELATPVSADVDDDGARYDE